MKSIRSFSSVAALAVALVSLSTRGQSSNFITPVGLPASLPIGTNEMAMRHWIITNRTCYASVTVIVTNYDGEYAGGNIASPTNFATYADYQQYVLSVASTALATIKMHPQISPNASVSIFICVLYDPADFFHAMNVRAANIATIGTVTDACITNVSPMMEMVLVPFPNLKRLDITVDSNPPFIYSSSSATNSFGNHYRQVYVNDMLALYSWYCMGTNRVRITATIGSNTGDISLTYLQNGRLREPADLLSTGQTHWQLTSTPGSDTDIQATEDYTNWQKVAGVAWDSNAGLTNFDLPQLTSQRFYRAVSK